MKSIAVLLAAAALVAAPMTVQNAHAQVEVTLGGGLNSPMGDYGDQSKMGFTLTSGVGYRIIPMLSVGAELNYHANDATDEFVEALGPDVSMSSNILQYGAVARFMVPVGFHNLYAKGSVGNYRGTVKVSSPLGSASLTTSHLGYAMGAGIMINGPKSASLFADATYHTVTFDDAPEATTFMTFNAGAVFSFGFVK